MKERPILFSAPMVRAILEGRKTVTRRIVRLPRGVEFDGTTIDSRCVEVLASRPDEPTGTRVVACPYGQQGDRLWVRETWAPWSEHLAQTGESEALRDAKAQMPWACIEYRATDEQWIERWRPSIFMPRWASRITLGVVSVRVERLHEITEEDAKCEGVSLPERPYPDGTPPHRTAFAALWDEINGKRAPWGGNPWVWRVEFRRVA